MEGGSSLPLQITIIWEEGFGTLNGFCLVQAVNLPLRKSSTKRTYLPMARIGKNSPRGNYGITLQCFPRFRGYRNPTRNSVFPISSQPTLGKKSKACWRAGFLCCETTSLLKSLFPARRTASFRSQAGPIRFEALFWFLGRPCGTLLRNTRWVTQQVNGLRVRGISELLSGRITRIRFLMGINFLPACSRRNLPLPRILRKQVCRRNPNLFASLLASESSSLSLETGEPDSFAGSFFGSWTEPSSVFLAVGSSSLESFSSSAPSGFPSLSLRKGERNSFAGPSFRSWGINSLRFPLC